MVEHEALDIKFGAREQKKLSLKRNGFIDKITRQIYRLKFRDYKLCKV